MRKWIRGAVALTAVSFFLALGHSCSLDNHILKPACLVFEIDLVQKWWMPDDASMAPVFFGSNGYITMEGSTDSLSFMLQNCNKIMVTDYTNNDYLQWTIKHITPNDLHLKFPDKEVKYSRKQ